MAGAALSLRIRKATEADADLIAGVLRRAFDEFESFYTKKGFAATVLNPEAVDRRMHEGPVWIVASEGRVVATAAALLTGHGVYVRGMAALPSARGLGIGRRLLEEVESFALASEASRLFLSTTPFLTQAIRLYRRCGFLRTAEGPHDLFGTPLFTMQKRLISSA